MTTSRLVGVLLCVALLSAARLVSANGRFPEANHVLVSPIDPNEIIVRVSFGLLVSRDGGKKFGWVCEQALGLSESEDPMYAYAKTNGRLVGSTYQGVLVSSDHACSWPKVEGVAGKLFVDLTQRAVERERTIVFESKYDGREEDGGTRFHSQLWESVDDATTFNAIGTLINPRLVGYTVDLAPTDRERIYATGVERFASKSNARGALLVSNDRGTTWTEHSIAINEDERSIFIAAVDPTNPNRIYVRTHGAADKPSRLLLSDDGGVTFRTIFTSQTPLLGFALSSDGARLYVGSASDGLHVASTSEPFAFRKTSSIEVQCITIAADNRLWVCSAETSGFIVAYSKDDGASFEGKTHFTDITGPLDCPPTPPFDQCVTGWSALRTSLGFDRPLEDAGAPDAAAPPAPTTTLTARGSGCSSASTSTVVGAWLLGLGVVVAAWVFRRAKFRSVSRN